VGGKKKSSLKTKKIMAKDEDHIKEGERGGGEGGTLQLKALSRPIFRKKRRRKKDFKNCTKREGGSDSPKKRESSIFFSRKQSAKGTPPASNPTHYGTDSLHKGRDHSSYPIEENVKLGRVSAGGDGRKRERGGILKKKKKFPFAHGRKK